MKEEADLDVLRFGERGCGSVGEELESHGRGVVRHAVKVSVDGGELSETKKGLKVGVGTELNVEFALTRSVDGVVEAI